MGAMPDWFWWVAGAGIIVALAVRWWLGPRRSLAADKVARRLGLSFNGPDGSFSPDYFLGVPLFQAGFAPTFLNVMRGQVDGAEALLFECRQTIGTLLAAMTSKSSLGGDGAIGDRQSRGATVNTMTVAAFRVPMGILPHFELREEGGINKIADPFKGEDIAFPEHAAFSKRFLLRGPNPDRIRRVFDSPLLDYLTRQEIPLCVEAAGDWLVVYSFASRVPVRQLASFWGQASGIRSMLLEGAERALRAGSHS